MPQGTVKDYDPATGEGTLLLEDGTEVRFDREAAEGTEIRLLRIGQRVAFELVEGEPPPRARGLHIVTFS